MTPNPDQDLSAEYVALCVCAHPAYLHTGPWYSTGLGSTGRGCDECPCAYYCPDQSDGDGRGPS